MLLRKLKKRCISVNKSHKKWFTKDLFLMRKEVKTLGRKLRRNPYDKDIRDAYHVNVRIYNSERKRSSRNYTQEMVNKLDMLRDNNPQAYWKLLSQLKDKVQNENVCIPLNEWFEYFKRLNKADTPCTGNRMKILTDLHKLAQQTVFN